MNTSPWLSPFVCRFQHVIAAGVVSAALLAPPVARAVTEPSALTGEKKSYAYSWQQEVQEGAEADKEITQQMGLYDNPQVQAYVDSVGRRVLQASTFANPSTPEMYRNTKFTFRVLDTPVVNAFALPGGYVYVTRGLLSHVDNEAQLAVVLGHEIGHVAARHSSQQARRSQWGQLGVIAGAILGQAVLGDRMPNLAENVMSTGSQAMKVFLLRYSREAETQADDLGVNYALNAGYAAGESARFFDALKRESQVEGQGIPTWLSSHPDPGNRADHVVELARQHRNPNREAIVGTDEYLRAIDGIIVGEDPRQGFTSNGVFYHPTLHFQVPVASGWKVDNQPAAVVMAEPNGRAVLALRVAAANRIHDAATQFVSENKVQVTASGDTAVNGLPTTVIVGRATTEQGQVGVWDAFIEYDGKVYSLLGYAAAQGFDQMRPTFESVAGGFGPLRDPRLANVQPAHLRVVRADRAAPFATFIPTSLPPKFTAETVAIMNQVGLNENVPAGAPLKMPDLAPPPSAQPVIATTDSNPATPPPAPYPQSSPTYPPSTSGGYPPSSTPPPGYPAPYPSQGNPYPGGPYPAPSSYPPANGSPPANNYPPANTYPPADAYPGPAPQPTTQGGYPSPSGYPAPAPSPSTSGYPSYPSSNPPPSYPPATSPYPPSNNYPGAGGYPPASYPAPSQSTGTQTASPPNPPPNWPR